MQNVAQKKCLLQLLAKIYPNISDGSMFKINKSESALCNGCGHSTNNDNKKEQMKRKDIKRRKEKRDNLVDDEKE